MEQLAFHYLDQTKFEEYLTRSHAIHSEQERLRIELQAMREEYGPYFHLKGVEAALKVALIRRKLARRDSGAVSVAEQEHLLAKVEAHLDKLEREVEDLTRTTPSTTAP